MTVNRCPVCAYAYLLLYYALTEARDVLHLIIRVNFDDHCHCNIRKELHDCADV